jgi:hypothetical protein
MLGRTTLSLLPLFKSELKRLHGRFTRPAVVEESNAHLECRLIG